jgi:spore germination cell wall hydrolase CwlJ-like protein
MDPAAIAGLCALLARGASAQPLPAGVNCPPIAAASSPPSRAPQGLAGRTPLAAALASDTARDAIARVAYAEAANQGDSGLAGVVYTILNRVQDGRWGASVEAVVNARGQFEPVMRAGGSWRQLRPVSVAQRARIDTILNLALDGRLPDLTNGARFFQNADVVAAREAAGTVSPGLTDFGGAPRSARIGDHSFYVEAGRGGTVTRTAVSSTPPAPPPVSIFVGENRAGERSELVSAARADPFAGPVVLHAEPSPDAEPSAPTTGDPLRGIFILPDGRESDRGR